MTHQDDPQPILGRIDRDLTAGDKWPNISREHIDEFRRRFQRSLDELADGNRAPYAVVEPVKLTQAQVDAIPAATASAPWTSAHHALAGVPYVIVPACDATGEGLRPPGQPAPTFTCVLPAEEPHLWHHDPNGTRWAPTRTAPTPRPGWLRRALNRILGGER